MTWLGLALAASAFLWAAVAEAIYRYHDDTSTAYRCALGMAVALAAAATWTCALGGAA